MSKTRSGNAFRLTAHAPLSALLRSLERAGWGELHGRKFGGVRSVLRALTARLPDKSGEGLVTVFQLQMAAGLGEKWTRVCLHKLEDLGIIRWTRGGIISGKPHASWIRVQKTRLLELIKKARHISDKRTRANNEARDKRLRKITGAVRFMFRTRNADVHAVVNTDLLSSKEGSISGASLPSSQASAKLSGSSEQSYPDVSRRVREAGINARFLAAAHEDSKRRAFLKRMEELQKTGLSAMEATKRLLFEGSRKQI